MPVTPNPPTPSRPYWLDWLYLFHSRSCPLPLWRESWKSVKYVPVTCRRWPVCTTSCTDWVISFLILLRTWSRLGWYWRCLPFSSDGSTSDRKPLDPPWCPSSCTGCVVWPEPMRWVFFFSNTPPHRLWCLGWASCVGFGLWWWSLCLGYWVVPPRPQGACDGPFVSSQATR